MTDDDDKAERRPTWEPQILVAARYRLQSRLGGGGGGDVWSAEDTVTEERVAIKLLRSVGAESARIRHEIGTLRALRLPGVVRLLDEGSTAAGPFLVMELVAGAPFPGAAPINAAVESPMSADSRAVVGATLDATASTMLVTSPMDEESTSNRGRALAGTYARLAAPAPSRRPRWTWTELEDRAVAFLEILMRVHQSGIIHRDLKPGNVLVRGDGRPVILDFGLSFEQQGDQRITSEGKILGTPLYFSPEQIRAEDIDERTDIYAVGLMLYEALTGRLPHESSDVRALMLARVTQPALPVHDIAPGVPLRIANLIDRMLATDPSARPRCVDDILAVIQGRPIVEGPYASLPRLGGDACVQEVLGSILRGNSIDITGPPGSGRSRCLKDVAEALARAGRYVMATCHGLRPLSSLEPILGSFNDRATEPFAAILDLADARLRQGLEAGCVLMIDDADQIDPWSARIVERCRDAGVIVRALPAGRAPAEALRIERLPEEALRALFSGPDRIFHLREDAAHCLYLRTDGLPARIEAEVMMWLGAGMARRAGNTLVIKRTALDRLEAGLPLAAPRRRSPSASNEPFQCELLEWLALAGPTLDAAELAAAIGQPLWRIEADLGALMARGAVRRAADGKLEALEPAEISWPPSTRRAAHDALAEMMRPGERGRLAHLLAAERGDLIAAEAIHVARREANEGRHGAAIVALHQALSAARRRGDEDEAERSDEELLLAEWLQLAFAEHKPTALDRVDYEICMTLDRNPLTADREVVRLSRLVKAALAARSVNGQEALAMADAIPPFEDPRMERWRHWVRVRAATRDSVEALAAAVAEGEVWAARAEYPPSKSILAGWMGILRYNQSEFDDAARLHAEAAEGEAWPAARLAATLNCASALLEAFRHSEAAERAREAAQIAARCRHEYFQGRAEWLSRAAQYRMGELFEPDLELVELAAQVGVPELESLVCANEAAIAWRSSQNEVAAELAGRAAALWKIAKRRSPQILVECLQAASQPAPERRIRQLAADAWKCQGRGLGVQALGLLARAYPWLRPLPKEELTALCAGIPKHSWGLRMDIISADEALLWACPGAPAL